MRVGSGVGFEPDVEPLEERRKATKRLKSQFESGTFFADSDLKLYYVAPYDKRLSPTAPGNRLRKNIEQCLASRCLLPFSCMRRVVQLHGTVRSKKWIFLLFCAKRSDAFFL